MAFGIDDAVTAVTTLIKDGIDKIWPDATEVEKAKITQLTALLSQQMEYFKGQANIIIAEAQGGSWIQRSWRPITMLTFLYLIVSYFYGFYGSNFGEPMAMELFGIIKLGLGGYVVGRSVEKIAPDIVKALKR